MCPKATEFELERPKCCGCKKRSCVKLLSAVSGIIGTLMIASTYVSFYEPCDEPLAPLMMTISGLVVCFAFLFCGLPEHWYRCGVLTVISILICWLIPANYFFFKSKTCHFSAMKVRTSKNHMFDIYSSTEIVVLLLDTFVSFGCFASALTRCDACINNGRYYTEEEDDIDQLYYKHIEEGGDVDKLSEPLLSGEDREDPNSPRDFNAGNISTGSARNSAHNSSKHQTTVRARRKKQNERGTPQHRTPRSRNAQRSHRGGGSSGENSDFGPSANSDFHSGLSGNDPSEMEVQQEFNCEDSSATEDSESENETLE